MCESVAHSLSEHRHAWVHVAEGEVTLNSRVLNAGAAAAVSDQEKLELAAAKPAMVLVFDLN